uniref:Cytochrome d ubiquinol oxidase subunit II n=1 Tax=Desulfobacca acetoxidans TaxID=60893 RepID=A0A7C3V6S5_9BACT
MMADGPHLLAEIWFWLIGFILILYVILDGFDLGAGIIFLGTRDEKRRSQIMGSLGYTWHATRPGWWSWEASSSVLFPWLTGSCSQPSISRSASCFSG